ncbi:MAG: hypothetical protein O8C67_04895 [Candidatus Methanoperedens sp.]|nr:hypothetical protein [Candidatus Methanoperedens sp.]
MNEETINVETLRNQKTQRAMYKIIDGKLIVIAKDKNGLPIVFEEKI